MPRTLWATCCRCAGLGAAWALTQVPGRADPPPTQPATAVNPPFTAGALNAPFPANYYGAGHGGGTLTLTYPFTSPFGYPDHSRGIFVFQVAPFTPRHSEGVYGMDVWLEQQDASGNWNAANLNGGIADGADSAYQPVNTPNPGPSPSYQYQWTYAAPTLPAYTAFRVFTYVYLYNQGGGSQGNFYVASSLGSIDTGAADDAPRLSWTPSAGPINPTEVAAGQAYEISADAEDDNGNLATVTLWKNGQLAASTGGGDGWSANAAVQEEDPPGTMVYTAQAADDQGLTSPLLTWTVTVDGKLSQPPVTSADATLPWGQPFTPAYFGGAGGGADQFAVVGFTNWDAGVSANAGTLTDAWSSSWLPPAAGPYTFWVAQDGDSAYNPSLPAGPYQLTVTAPPVLPPPAAPAPAPAPVPPPAPPATAPTPPVPPGPPASGSPPASPAPPSVYRIRFDPTGADVRVTTGATAPGASRLWTDPAGLAASPWPVWASPPPALVTPGNVVLPPAPTAAP